MLTADLVRPRLRLRGSELLIDLLNEHDPFWLQTADELIGLFRGQAGRSLEAWDRALDAYMGDRTDYIVVRGLAKVLIDAATFTPVETPLPPVQLRERLFAYGPAFETPQLFHPQTRYEVMSNVADEQNGRAGRISAEAAHMVVCAREALEELSRLAEPPELISA